MVQVSELLSPMWVTHKKLRVPGFGLAYPGPLGRQPVDQDLSLLQLCLSNELTNFERKKKPTYTHSEIERKMDRISQVLVYISGNHNSLGLGQHRLRNLALSSVLPRVWQQLKYLSTC